MEFNAVHDRAVQMVRANRLQDALKLFYHLAEGDRSLDGGSLGHSIGECSAWVTCMQHVIGTLEPSRKIPSLNFIDKTTNV